jgi:cyclomaltodextrinase / maltogenic alpha-amylase / neopullulanase
LTTIPAWVRDAVFYQVFPDRFASSPRVVKPGPLEDWDAPPTRYGFKGGDLLGLTERLDYLADLGITAIYLNPIFASPANHRYHTYDYLHVDPLLGGDAALRELLESAHARGMRVILDGVFNHSGRGFWPFHHVLEAGASSPYRDWFHINPEFLEAGRQLIPYPNAQQLAALDNAAAPGQRTGLRSLATLGYRGWWDLPALPKLNTDNPRVRAYLFEVAEHWIRFGADGWRLDVAGEIEDATFWQEFRQRVKGANPDAYLVGEIWRVSPEWLAGDRFDALMNYPMAEAILGYAAGTHLDTRVVGQSFELASQLHSLDGAGFGRRCEELMRAYDPDVVAAQLGVLGSHDTPRIRTLCGGDLRSVELSFLLLMALPGAPCIYYGDEIGMQGNQDPECRAGFPWQRPAEWEGELKRLVQQLTGLRRSEPALRGTGFRLLAAEGGACAFSRADPDIAAAPSMLVAINAGEADATLPLPHDIPTFSDAVPVIEVGSGPLLPSAAAGESAQLHVPARSAYLLRMGSSPSRA